MSQQLAFGRHYSADQWQDFKHLELNEVGGTKPGNNESSILCLDMHANTSNGEAE